MNSFLALRSRLERIDWTRVDDQLDECGWSRLGPVLTATECAALIRDYGREALFRSTVDMAHHRFGKGQYRYFNYPLPPLVDALRTTLYARLAATASRWAAHLKRPTSYPASLDVFLRHCHAQGQNRPTPLLLRYGEGDYNCLHQDVYGAVGFPVQVLVMLSKHGSDYDGGEVIFVEQRPRAQSTATAILPARGEALVFTNRERPVRGSRGFYAAQMRHGASVVSRGQRFVLGIIFHDAE